MWGTVLAIALVAAADPVRIGIAVLLFSRSRPVFHLVALWLGGMTVGFPARQHARVAIPVDDPSCQAAPSAFSRLSTRALDALQAGPLWITFVVGVCLTTDFRYLAVLTAILASGAAVGTQVSAAAVYTVVGLAFVEIPLACQLAAPAGTGAVMSRVHDWVKARRRAVLGVIVALLGVFLMTTGVAHV